MLTKDVPDIENCKEYIKIYAELLGIELENSYGLAIRDFQVGYEGSEQRKALKNLKAAFDELNSN